MDADIVEQDLVGRPPTQRQLELMRYVAEYLRDRGYAPSYREIGEHMGILSTNGIHDHLRALQRKGLLYLRMVNQKRALSLTPSGWAAVGLPRTDLPAELVRMGEERDAALARAAKLRDCGAGLAGESCKDCVACLQRELDARAFAAAAPQEDGRDLSIRRARRAVEVRLIREALRRTDGHRGQAARLLQLSLRALVYKLQAYGIT